MFNEQRCARPSIVGKFYMSFTKFPLLISDYYYYTRVPIYTIIIIIICSTALVTIIIISIANTDQLQLIVFNENDWFLKFFFLFFHRVNPAILIGTHVII